MTSASTEINTTLVINDYPGSLINWTWAKDQGYCTGLGTPTDPYIIEDIFFNTSSIPENCLRIRNSRKHFIVRNCEFLGNWNYAGVQLWNATDGVITENFMYPTTGALVWLLNSSHNIIRANNASAGNFYGFLIDGSSGFTEQNTVINNLISFNLVTGIELRSVGCKLNTIQDNMFINHTIGMVVNGYNATIKGNHFINNSGVGMTMMMFSQYNMAYENCFMTNALHAQDGGMNNTWDNGLRGNYWDNYTGPDANSDGIGDIPYNITGISPNQDRFPLMSCPVTITTTTIPGYDVFLMFAVGLISILSTILIVKRKKQTF
jgi:nitrous oxidase accessory protein NosD